jgi:hypothetical protein
MRTHARVARFALVLFALLGWSASPALAQPSIVHVTQPQVGVLRLLAGDWLGPFPASGGQCSTEYLEWFIYGTGSYTSTWNSYPSTAPTVVEAPLRMAGGQFAATSSPSTNGRYRGAPSACRARPSRSTTAS